MKNRVLGFVLVVAILFLFLPYQGISAEGTPAQLTLTRDECTERAINYTHNLTAIDTSIKRLTDQYNSQLLLSQQIQGRLNEKKLPDQTSQDLDYLFHTYIKNRDFLYYATKANIENTKVSRDLAKLTIVGSVKQVFDQIISQQDALQLQNELYDNMIKNNDMLMKKLKLGLTGELDTYLSNIEIQQQKIVIDGLKRTLENTKLSLKQLMGIPLTQEFVLKSNEDDTVIKDHQTYKQYMTSALSSRSEVVTAKRNLDVKQREQNILKNYVGDPTYVERLNAQEAVNKNTIAVSTAIDNVTKDIQVGYSDLISKRNAVDSAKQKLTNAQNRYKISSAQVALGYLASSALLDLQMQLTQAKISFTSAIRAYNSALYKLQLASGVGPGYKSNLGGN